MSTVDTGERHGPHLPLEVRLALGKKLRERDRLNEEKRPITAPVGSTPEEFRQVPPDVRETPVEGIQAWRKIVELADKHAKYIEESGLRAMNLAERFRADQIVAVDILCTPMMEAALQFNELSKKTAQTVREQAKSQADAAALFTKRIHDMSHALEHSANGGDAVEETENRKNENKLKSV